MNTPKNTDKTPLDDKATSELYDDNYSPCVCKNWCIWDTDKPLTNHHPNCRNVNDSLIDVWKVTDDENSFITDNPLATLPAVEKGSSVVKLRMQREVYDNLPVCMSF